MFFSIAKIEVTDPLTMWNQSGSSRAFEIWHRDIQALSRDRVMIIFLNYETPTPNKKKPFLKNIVKIEVLKLLTMWDR